MFSIFLDRSTGGPELPRIPTKIKTIHITKSLFDETIKNLQRIGLEDKEGIVYWTGKLNGDDAKIKNLIVADEYPEFENYELFAKMPLLSSYKIGELIHQRNEILFVQVHSHPFEAFHSLVDDNYPISHRLGFLSIVVPYFGKNVQDLQSCAVYEYLGNAEWKKLTQNEVASRFKIEEEAHID